MLRASPAILAARANWHYRGQLRPDFAEPTGPGEESVWDFPRPPRIEAVAERLRACLGDAIIAETSSGVRVLETAGAPTYYFPPEHVMISRLRRLDGASVCEWKGVAASYRLDDRSPAAWCYPETFPEFAQIEGWFAFYPSQLACYVGDERVTPQPGGYYGGWVTSRLRGPIKGEPGSGHW